MFQGQKVIYREQEPTSATLPHSGNIFPVLGHTEEVDDGVGHHGHQGCPDQQYLMFCKMGLVITGSDMLLIIT